MNKKVAIISCTYLCLCKGEQGIANAKADLDTSENRESKLVKELKKLNKKAHNTSSSLSNDQQQQLNDIKDKLEQSTREKELAKIEVSDKIREQEAVKMIRFKSGFNKLVVGYLDLAEKVHIIVCIQLNLCLTYTILVEIRFFIVIFCCKLGKHLFYWRA